jgi:hypothetical protein
MGKTHVIDGVTYVEVERTAEVGEMIIDLLDNGKVRTIVSPPYECRKEWYAYETEHGEDIAPIGQGEYRVLVEASPSVTDLLANLARRVSSLEQQLRDTQSNVEKLAEELANTRHRVSKHATMFGIVEERVGMLTDDIITLDERSQVLNAINKFYEEGSR